MYGFFVSTGYNGNGADKIFEIRVTAELDVLDANHITNMTVSLFRNGRPFKSPDGKEVPPKNANFWDYVSDVKLGKEYQRMKKVRTAQVIFNGPFPGDGDDE